MAPGVGFLLSENCQCLVWGLQTQGLKGLAGNMNEGRQTGV